LARRIVLVVNLGTPGSPTAADVADFLREFLGDPLVVDYPRWFWKPLLERVILRSRPHKVAEMYRSIAPSGAMPLTRGTEAIANALGKELGASFSVKPAYRYGAGAIAGELTAALRAGDDCVVIPLFPQRTCSSSETIVELADAVAAKENARGRVLLVRIEPDDDGYIAGLAGHVASTRAAEPFDHLVVSFHGIPRRYDRREGGRYSRDCRTTFTALLRAASIPPERATLSFQSRFGPEPWLGPATFDVLRSLARAGTRNVGVIMPGFLTEGLETLEEIGVRGREAFLEAGGSRYAVVPALEAAPDLIALLARRVESAVAGTTEDVVHAS
jgi:ferrochelatase